MRLWKAQNAAQFFVLTLTGAILAQAQVVVSTSQPRGSQKGLLHGSGALVLAAMAFTQEQASQVSAMIAEAVARASAEAMANCSVTIA